MRFRCFACIDQFGDKVVEMNTALVPVSHPKNAWARSEPPARLADVPKGTLHTSLTIVQCKNDTKIIQTVTDPENNMFNGHGAQIWPAAIVLSHHLLSRPRKWARGLSVVELGAGCGLPGLVLARCGARSVTLTDLPWQLPLTKYNIEMNVSNCTRCKLRAAPLRWGIETDVADIIREHGAPDLLIASDVVYRPQDFDALLTSILALGARENLLAMHLREDVVQAFERRLESLSWSTSICLWEDEMLLIRVWPPAEQNTHCELIPAAPIVQLSSGDGMIDMVRACHAVSMDSGHCGMTYAAPAA